MCRLALALACAACGATLAAAAALACPVARGERVVLDAQSMDPDVFVWDTAQRLADYSHGSYSVKAVLNHTMLAEAGTTAYVLRCRRGGVSAADVRDPVDLLFVRILGGPTAGRSGWISSEDARRLNGMPVSPRPE